MRILIAEDDVTSRTLLVGVLTKSGYEVVQTVNGAAAWEALQQHDAPSMVILDWIMPEMDGLEVLRRVRATPAKRPPYIIMLTAKGEKADIIAGLDAGANDYLAKPFDIGEFRARVSVGRRMVEMQDALIETQEALTHQATHDPLTGLLNRRAVLERMNEELARAGRHGGFLAVGLCDIDHFKRVNDTYGHQTGDDVLRGVARILSEGLRTYDSVGRVGGEEFLVLAPMADGTPCGDLFERLRARIAKSLIPSRSGALSVTVSIGLACGGALTGVDRLLGAADSALYRAKGGGRNRLVHAPQAVDPSERGSAEAKGDPQKTSTGRE